MWLQKAFFPIVTWSFYFFSFLQDYVLNEAKCRTIVRQICRGIEYIHKEGFIHLDIKPFNIVFYARNSDYDLRIIDFGLARALLGREGIKVGMCGTIEYMSPEVSFLINIYLKSTQSKGYGIGHKKKLQQSNKVR